MSLHRRELLGVAGGLVLGGLGSWAAQRYILPPMPQLPERELAPMLCPLGPNLNMTPEEALERLLTGNQRFIENRSQNRPGTGVPSQLLTRDYRPFAAILSCSDDRIGPDVVLDERVSELFVIRQAAHTLDPGTRMSVEYAANFLQVPLVLVLGHSGCTTLATVLGADRPDVNPPAYLQPLRTQLNTIVKEVGLLAGDPLENAILANIRHTIHQLRALPALQHLLREKKLQVLGAHWNLQDGKVEMLAIN